MRPERRKFSDGVKRRCADDDLQERATDPLDQKDDAVELRLDPCGEHLAELTLLCPYAAFQQVASLFKTDLLTNEAIHVVHDLQVQPAKFSGA
jgi:hypothetical protein